MEVVEQQRAVGRLFEQADVAPHRSGKSASLVAEELGPLEVRLQLSDGVGGEWSRAAARAVDQLGEGGLPGARGADEGERGARARVPCDALEHAEHPGRACDKVPQEVPEVQGHPPTCSARREPSEERSRPDSTVRRWGRPPLGALMRRRNKSVERTNGCQGVSDWYADVDCLDATAVDSCDHVARHICERGWPGGTQRQRSLGRAGRLRRRCKRDSEVVAGSVDQCSEERSRLPHGGIARASAEITATSPLSILLRETHDPRMPYLHRIDSSSRTSLLRLRPQRAERCEEFLLGCLIGTTPQHAEPQACPQRCICREIESWWLPGRFQTEHCRMDGTRFRKQEALVKVSLLRARHLPNCRIRFDGPKPDRQFTCVIRGLVTIRPCP